MSSADVQITILVDNQADPPLIPEHGLSLWIEAKNRHILFDTGQGNALETNAAVLGIDLGKTDILVLSHGHYDHSGGIDHVLRQAHPAGVYCHSGAVQPRYAIRNGTATSIQMPQKSMSVMDRLPEQTLHWVQNPMRLSETICITGPIPRETTYEDTGGPFYLDPEGDRTDPIDDDLALCIRKNDGLIVCVGCCHAGLVNTLTHARRLNDGLKVRAVIGGFHLLNASRNRLDQTITALRLLEPEMIAPCHCTGKPAVKILRNVFGKRVSPGMAGIVFRF